MDLQECVTCLVTKPFNEYVTRLVTKPPSMFSLNNIILFYYSAPSHLPQVCPKFRPFQVLHEPARYRFRFLLIAMSPPYLL